MRDTDNWQIFVHVYGKIIPVQCGEGKPILFIEVVNFVRLFGYQIKPLKELNGLVMLVLLNGTKMIIRAGKD